MEFEALPGWAEYLPPPGSKYRIRYVPENGHDALPDLAAMGRAIDARPAVAMKGIRRENQDNNVVQVDVVIYVGDQTLLSVLGTFASDGSDNFWNVDKVSRTDDGYINGVAVTIGKVFDDILDPVQDATTALQETARETVNQIKQVGPPSLLIVGVAIVAFLLARR